MTVQELIDKLYDFPMSTQVVVNEGLGVRGISHLAEVVIAGLDLVEIS